MIRLSDCGEYVADTKVVILTPKLDSVCATGKVIRHIRRAGNALFYSITGQQNLIPDSRVRIAVNDSNRAGVGKGGQK